MYNNKKDATIERIGTIGTAFAIICLLQLMIFLVEFNWVTGLMIVTYIISAIAYLLYFKQKPIYIYFLGIAGLLSLFITSYTLISGVISFIQIALTFLNLSMIFVSFEMKHLDYIKKVDAYKKMDI